MVRAHTKKTQKEDEQVLLLSMFPSPMANSLSGTSAQSVWGKPSAGAVGSFASILAQNVSKAPEIAEVYIPVQQDPRVEAQQKLQEDFKKWRQMMDQVDQTCDSHLAVKPRLKRRKDRDSFEDVEVEPIVLNAELLKKHFHYPLNVAAQKIGVCTTALKQACRKIGIKNWPHRMLKNMAQSMGGGAAAMGLDGSESARVEVDRVQRQDTASSLDDAVHDFEMGDSLEGWADLLAHPVDQSYHAVLADCYAGGGGNAARSVAARRPEEAAKPRPQPIEKPVHPYLSPKSFSPGHKKLDCDVKNEKESTSTAASEGSELANSAPFKEWMEAVQGGRGGVPAAWGSAVPAFSSEPPSSSDGSAAPTPSSLHFAARDSPPSWGSGPGPAPSVVAGGAGAEHARQRAEFERLRGSVRELVQTHGEMLRRLVETQEGLTRELHERADLENSIALLHRKTNAIALTA